MISGGISIRFQSVVACCGSALAFDTAGGRADVVQEGVVAVNGTTPC